MKLSPVLRKPLRLASSPSSRFQRIPNINSSFHSSSSSRLRSTEITESNFQSLSANSSRLWDSIHHTSQWGIGKRYGESPEETGMSRLTLSDADKSVRKWFVETTQSLSCQTIVDSIGNIFAIRPGLRNDLPATFVGSHLDTQPTGGRFDGVLGVCAGVEMLKVLNENWIETEGPVGVVNWTNEEGARFPLSMMGSGVWAGALKQDNVYRTREVAGERKTVEEELSRIDFLGNTAASWKEGVEMAGHFELHIEQGPKLESAGEKIGIVEGVQAYKWLTVEVKGRDCHTGTTEYEHRADALYWAAGFIRSVQDLAKKRGGLASTGIIKAEPGSVNTIPGLVTFSLDVRHHRDDELSSMLKSIQTSAKDIEIESRENGTTGVRFTMMEDFASSAVQFHPDALACVEAAGKSVLRKSGRPIRRMTSGAGHDSVFTNRRCPTAMIFVPCRDGVSHHPEEWCEKDDCATGASVVIQSVLRFDQGRKRKGDMD